MKLPNWTDCGRDYGDGVGREEESGIRPYSSFVLSSDSTYLNCSEIDSELVLKALAREQQSGISAKDLFELSDGRESTWSCFVFIHFENESEASHVGYMTYP